MLEYFDYKGVEISYIFDKKKGYTVVWFNVGVDEELIINGALPVVPFSIYIIGEATQEIIEENLKKEINEQDLYLTNESVKDYTEDSKNQ